MDQTVKLWQTDGHQEKSVLEQGAFCLALSPDNSMVASANIVEMKLWDTATGEVKFNLKGHTQEVKCVAFSPDGKTLASGGDDPEIILWNTTTGEVRRRLIGHTNTVWSLAFLDNGLTLASTGEDGTVRLWSMTTGEGRTLVERPNKLSTLVVLPDQTLAVGGWDDYVIELWDLPSQRQRLTLRGHQGAVRAMALMNAGRQLVTGSWDGTVRLWNLQSGGQSELLTRHPDVLYAVAVSPDGTTLASGGRDGTVKLLDLNTRQQRLALKGHTGGVNTLAFSANGKLLISGGSDIRLWRAATDEEVAGAASDHFNRD